MSCDMLVSVWPKYLNLVHQTVFRACRYGLGTILAVAMTPVSIATAIDKSGPNLQLALQLLVLFYILKQQLHTPSH